MDGEDEDWADEDQGDEVDDDDVDEEEEEDFDFGGDDEFHGGAEEEEEEEGEGRGSGRGAFESQDSPGLGQHACVGGDEGGKLYKLLTMEDIVASQLAKVAHIHELLGIASSFARILLVHYGWDEDKLVGHFFERGVEYVYKSAGVVPPEGEEEREKEDTDDSNAGPTSKVRKTEVSCESCMDDVLEDNTTKLNCGHRFCNDCYQTYVAMKINEGQANAITCMAYKCNTKLDENLIPKLVTEPSILQKYYRTQAESYVNDNPMVKWCTSTPHCGHAAEALWSKQIEVQCNCRHRFCFNCLKDPHSPLPCNLLSKWMEKCLGEGETLKYIAANTKDCPKCHSAVEKNGGCNLMSCRCGAFFCWLCGAQTGQAHTWERITGHSCGKYDDQTMDADEARVSLERYMHYYIRYKAHNDSSVLESQMRITLLGKVSTLFTNTGTFTAYEEKWFARALDMLFECRRVLKWSYVLAYFIFGDEGKKKVDDLANKAHKMLFEDHQDQLELLTEVLSQKLETPPERMDHKLHMDVMNITVLAERRCKGLYDVILSDILAKGAYGFDISPYSYSLELSSLHSEQASVKPVTEEQEETEIPLVVGLHRPVPKVELKKDDNVRAKQREARQLRAAIEPEPRNKDEKDKPRTKSKRNKIEAKKEDTQEEREELKQAEQEMMLQAIAASMEDF